MRPKLSKKERPKQKNKREKPKTSHKTIGSPSFPSLIRNPKIERESSAAPPHLPPPAAPIGASPCVAGDSAAFPSSLSQPHFRKPTQNPTPTFSSLSAVPPPHPLAVSSASICDDLVPPSSLEDFGTNAAIGRRLFSVQSCRR